MNVLASRFRQREIEAEMLRKVAAIVLEVGAEAPAPRPLTSQLPLDPWRLRGVPVVGRRGAIGGAIRGTRPGDSLR
ncbi:MAG TPA: hypothetical protein VIR59_13410 [Gaiellaceae bacterium]